jgi:uncharacterized protein (UPF0335 family)
MIDIILTDAINRIELEVKTNPDNYADIYSELRELLFVMRTFRDFIDNPTLEQLEQLESDKSLIPTLWISRHR